MARTSSHRAWSMKSLLRRRKKVDVYIVSYPKSGRTWLKVMVGRALCVSFGLPTERTLDTYFLTSHSPALRTRFVHDGSSVEAALPSSGVAGTRRRYRGKKVVLLVRDVGDVLVSSYFQARERTSPRYTGSIGEFIRSDTYGVAKVMAFYESWYEQRAVPRELLIVRYEEMHRDPRVALRDVLRFIGLDGIRDEVLEQAVTYGSFDHMQELERSDAFHDGRLRARDPGNLDSYKVRRGVVHGFTEYLEPDDIEFIQQRVAASTCPWLVPSS